MEAGRARGYRDNPRLPTLSLGLSSVRLIVNEIEAEYARAVTSENGRELVKYDPNIDEGYDDYYDSPLDESRGRVWSRFAVNLGKALSLCIPSVSFANFGVLAVLAGFFAPRMISYLVLYPFCRLVFGTLYPAYASYKAVRTKNLKEYVKWMMYWIVFALFTCTETFTDVFLSWFPFYYEVKIVLVLWLLSPATKGSSILYRKFVHPALCRREQEIDEYIAKAKDQGYHTVLNLGTKGVNYATTVIMQTAIKGGGGLVQQIRKSYSLSDLSECEPREERGGDEADDVMTEPRLIRRVAKNVYNTRRSASESNSRSPMYFPEVDVDVRNTRPNRTDEPDFSHIKSSEDISSGYSSADNSASLTRTASMGASARVKARTTRTTVTTIKRPQAAEDNEVIIEELHDDDSLVYANMPALVNLPPSLYLSDTDPPFIYQYVGDQIKIIQVLGNNPLTTTFNNETNNPDQWDQTEATFEDASSLIEIVDNEHDDSTYISTVENVARDEPNVSTKPTDEHESTDVSKNTPEVTILKNDGNTDVNTETKSKDNKLEDNILDNQTNTAIIPKTDSKDNKVHVDVSTVIEHESDDKLVYDIQITKNEEAEIPIQQVVTDETIDITSLDASLNENYSAESDDEASFGTPEDSPKSKRKSPKGKYGKGKAPPPPIVETELSDNNKTALDDKILDCAVSTTSQESLVDFVNKMPNTVFKETGFKGLQVVNPIAEKKRRHKSKSPGRIPKGNSSGIGKLLQLPSKLAFWKTDDKPKDNISTSSGDRSRRSSTIDRSVEEFQSCNEPSRRSSTIERSVEEFQSCNEPSKRSTIERSVEEFQSCNELNNIGRASMDLTKKDEDQISFKDATDFDNEISHDIMEKSDALQKLIEAKLESHPEYKIVSLHEEIPTTSKSTDV